MSVGDKKPVIMEADIGVEGGVPPYLHATQHSASGTDPITPHMIGAKSNEGLLINSRWDNPDNIIDQRGGYVVPPGTPYWSAMVDGTHVGTTNTYYKATVNATRSDFHEITIDGVIYYVYTGAGDALVRGYVGTGYTIDGWRGNNAVVLLHDGEMEIIGTSVYGNISEKIEYEQYVGKTVTLSALITGGTGIGQGAYLNIAYKSSAETSKYITETGIVSLTFTLPEDSTMLRLGLVTSSRTGMSLKSKAIKLELGSTQTLAHQDEDGNWVLNDPPPDKHLELLKCCMSTADPSDTYANNKLTPAAINAVNKAGDYMFGPLHFKDIGHIDVAADGNGDWTAWFVDARCGEYFTRFVNFCYADGRIAPVVQVAKAEDGTFVRDALLLHTGNKPSGSYTGNGDATARTIETGGIGDRIWIRTLSSWNTFLSPNGGFAVHNATCEIIGIPKSEAYFENGILTISSKLDCLNTNTAPYYYQVP